MKLGVENDEVRLEEHNGNWHKMAAVFVKEIKTNSENRYLLFYRIRTCFPERLRYS